MPVSSAISRTAASSGVSSPSRWPFGRHHSRRPARLRRAMTAAWSTPSRRLTTMPPAEVSSTTGSGADGTRVMRVAGVDAQRMTARRRWHAPGDGWTRRARHIDTVTTWQRPARPARAARRRAAPPTSGRLGRVPSLDPSVGPDSPDLSAALVALQKRALGVLAGLPADALELGELFRAAGHELALVGGPVRDAFLGRASADLDFATSATPGRDAGDPGPLGRRALGHRQGVRHHRRPPVRRSALVAGGRRRRRGDHVPDRRVRPDVAQAAGRVRRLARGRPVAPRLHGELDGGPACRT